MAEQATAESEKLKLEHRKQYWRKEGLVRRIAFLVKEGCNADSVKQSSGEELVHYCLIAEGLIAGKLPRKLPPTLEPMQMLQAMLQQMQSQQAQQAQQVKAMQEAAEQAQQSQQAQQAQ